MTSTATSPANLPTWHDGPFDLTNPHAITYAMPSAAGFRRRYALTDREQLAELRLYERRAAQRIRAASAPDGWGTLSTVEVDGIPGDGRTFGPGEASVDHVGRAVDADYRSAVLSAARHTIIHRARLTGDAATRQQGYQQAQAAGIAAAVQLASYETHAADAALARDYAAVVAR